MSLSIDKHLPTGFYAQRQMVLSLTGKASIKDEHTSRRSHTVPLLMLTQQMFTEQLIRRALGLKEPRRQDTGLVHSKDCLVWMTLIPLLA